MKDIKDYLRVLFISLKAVLPFVNLTFKDKNVILYYRYLAFLHNIRSSPCPSTTRIGSRLARIVRYLEKRGDRAS